jgi:hypothetical protein
MHVYEVRPRKAMANTLKLSRNGAVGFHRLVRPSVSKERRPANHPLLDFPPAMFVLVLALTERPELSPIFREIQV